MYIIRTVQRGRRPISSRSTWTRRMPTLRYPTIPQIGAIRFTPAQNITVNTVFLKKHQRMIFALVESGIIEVHRWNRTLKLPALKEAIASFGTSVEEEAPATPEDTVPEETEPPAGDPVDVDVEPEESGDAPPPEEPETEEESEEPTNESSDEPERAHDEDGRFVGDDPSTPDVNEAWEGGVAPSGDSEPEEEVEEEPEEVVVEEASEFDPEPAPEDEDSPPEDAPPTFEGPKTKYTKMLKPALLELMTPHFEVDDSMTKRELLAHLGPYIK